MYPDPSPQSTDAANRSPARDDLPQAPLRHTSASTTPDTAAPASTVIVTGTDVTVGVGVGVGIGVDVGTGVGVGVGGT